MATRQIVLHISLFLLVAVLLWFLLPFFGFDMVANRLMLILGVGIFWAAGLAILQFFRHRRAKRLEESLQKQALDQMQATTPDKKAELEAIRLQFENAMLALKNSNLAKDALSVLPWFLIIGPPASGKSTLLLHSGLQFPFLGDAGKGISGVGGTRNCEWWFSNEGVFLDTAGRYISEEEDRQEWLGFLALLRQHRKGPPVNGVIVAMSFGDILKADSDHLEWHAKNIRRRINELIQVLGVVFPVYLVFTKCDLLHGFRQFFLQLNPAETEQVWGATFPIQFEKNLTSSKQFQAEFQLLLQRIQARLPVALQAAYSGEEAANVFCYPFQLAFVQEKLGQFIDCLFQSSSYEENPIFRGFYLTSALQAGRPSDEVYASLSKSTGIPLEPVTAGDRGTEARSFFLKHFITNIVCKDGAVASPSAHAGRRQRILKAGVIGASASIGAIVGGLFIQSFYHNKSFVQKFVDAERQAMNASLTDERQFAENILKLQPYQAAVQELMAHQAEGVPLRLAGGLYRGNLLVEPAKELYLQLFESLYVAQARQAIESGLRRFVAEPSTAASHRDSDFHYSLLKMYLMMANPGRVQSEFLESRLHALWDQLIVKAYGKDIPDGLTEAVHSQITLFVRCLGMHHIVLQNLDQVLVSKARLVLQEVPVAERYFSRLRQEAALMASSFKNPLIKVEPYSIDRAVAGQKEIILNNKSVVPALFTPEGFKVLYPDARDKVLREAAGEGWVLNVEELPRKDLETALEHLYFEQYVREWRQFINNTKMLPADSLPEILHRLEVLSRKNSQLVALLKDIDKNTRLVSLSEEAKGKVFNFIVKAKAAEPSQANPVTSTFDSLHEFVNPTGEIKESALDRYNAELNKAGSALTALGQIMPNGKNARDTKELRQARLNTEVILRQLDGDIRDDIRPLLIQSFLLAEEKASEGELEGLNVSLKQEVTPVCMQSIIGHYPFVSGNRTKEEVSFADLGRYFHPQVGAFWKFYQTRLQSTLQEEHGRWVIKTPETRIAPGFIEAVRQTDVISQGLFGKGSSEPKVTFEVRPVGVPGVDEVRLHIDGRELRYRMELEEWHQFVWPGSGEAPGATLEVYASGSREPKILHYDGRWGWFRLLGSAKVTQLSSTEFSLEWTLTSSESPPLKARFDLKADSSKNPFIPGTFMRFRCPAAVGL